MRGTSSLFCCFLSKKDQKVRFQRQFEQKPLILQQQFSKIVTFFFARYPVLLYVKTAAGHWTAAVFRFPVFKWLFAKQRLVTYCVFCFNLFKTLQSVAPSRKILLLNQPKFYVQLRTTTTQKTSDQKLEVLSFTTKCNGKCNWFFWKQSLFTYTYPT